MYKKQETSINVLRALKFFIDEPTISKNYDDIIELRKETSESRIREALRSLEKIDILNTEYKRGKPRTPKEFGSQRRRFEHKIRSKNYQMSLEPDIFKKIFDIFNEGSIDVFLKSNYVDKMIEIYTLKQIYKQLEEEFKSLPFRRNATIALLNLPAAKKEYEAYPDKIYNYLQDCREHL